MKIIAAAAACALFWRSDALSPPDSADSHLRGGKTRELSNCATEGKYYPYSPDGSFSNGKCKYMLNCNIPGYDTAAECCKENYNDQATHVCTCSRDDLDSDLKRACDATFEKTSQDEDAASDSDDTEETEDTEETDDTEGTEQTDEDTAKQRSDVIPNTAVWAPVLMGPAIGVDLLEQCFADDSKPNAHPCNALETVAALYHDSHGDTDHVKEVYDEFLEEINSSMEFGSACDIIHMKGNKRFYCPDGHYCKVNDIGKETEGYCEVCPDNYDDCREGDGICQGFCELPPKGQCNWQDFEYECPKGTFCEFDASDYESLRDCIACPIHPDECEDLFPPPEAPEEPEAPVMPNNPTTEEKDAYDVLWAQYEVQLAELAEQMAMAEYEAQENADLCRKHCKSPKIKVLANTNGGGGMTTYNTPGDMLLLEYNIGKKKAVHSRPDNYVSINQLYGGYNNDHYYYSSEDSKKADTNLVNEHWDRDSPWKKLDKNYEPVFSEAMLMYCCYNEQFVGGGVGVGDSPASAPMGFA